MTTSPVKRTVLVVDDEPQIRRALTSILRVRDFDVVAAEDAAAALDATLQTTPDLIVLDLTLPDTDGLTLLPACAPIWPAPSSCCRPAPTRVTRSTRSTWGPTTT